jgi:hypothetical protein
MIDARELTQMDYGNPQILKTIVEAVCDFNYNKELMTQAKKHFGDKTLVDRGYEQWLPAAHYKRVA